MRWFRVLRSTSGVLAICSAIAVGGLANPVPAAAENQTIVRDGSSQLSAAASCWEIKQVAPTSKDGSYWLQTPKLIAPEKFYCDMTTDGGGWVLVGRGRDGWSYGGDGRGTAAEVRDKTTGVEAFSPRQLPNATIDGLLNGSRVDALADGIRVRRATSTDGQNWQEVRFKLKSRDTWSWAFGAGYPLASYSFDGKTSTSAATTYRFSLGNDLNTVWTYESVSTNWQVGFNYGATMRGSNSDSSYLLTTNSNYSVPFAQVWLRPKLLTSDVSYPTVGDQGTEPLTNLALASSKALPGKWGVTGLGAAGDGELASEVAAFAQIGNVMYVGGNFLAVQKGATESYHQPYLAAFDATTGDWIPSFKPQLNNQVKALVARPDGTLLVGGQFTEVNGSNRVGLVALNASTGEIAPNFNVSIENRTSNSIVQVRALGVSGPWLYLGGSFTHLKGGNNQSAQYARNAGRVKLTDGSADSKWNPDFNGSVAALSPSEDGTRVYFGGYFTMAGTTKVSRGAAISTATPATANPNWIVQHSLGTQANVGYQQAVVETKGRVWLAGSQHSFFGYDRDTFQLNTTTITKSGGDGQVLTATPDVVYAGCHCGDFAFSGTIDYSGTIAGNTTVSWSKASEIGFVGGWDARTGEFIPEFSPQLKARDSEGAWAITQASDETLWVGGTFTSAINTKGVNQWVGGFVRFANRDHTAPEAPTALTAEFDGSSATLSWTPSPSADVTYEVLRGGRVVATTTDSRIVIVNAAGSDRYFVRAADASGNRSASTSVAVLAQSLIKPGSTWAYYFNNDQPVATDWSGAGFDQSSWSTGAAPLGWGSPDIVTNIDTKPTRALASYHRKSFEISDPSALGPVKLTTRADDGVVVYVNGVEVGRANMPTGKITGSTYALSSVKTAAAAAAPVSFKVDSSILQQGTNVVAVEVHSNFRNTSNTSMELSMVAEQVGTR